MNYNFKTHLLIAAGKQSLNTSISASLLTQLGLLVDSRISCFAFNAFLISLPFLFYIQIHTPTNERWWKA